MTILSAVTLVMFAGAPSVGVVVSKRAAVAPEVATRRAEAVRASLGPELPVEDFTACAAKRPCLVKEAQLRGWSAVVLVETATVLGDALLSVTLLSTDARELARFSLQTPEDKLSEGLVKAAAPMRLEVEKLAAPAPVAVVAPPMVPAKPEAPPTVTPSPVSVAAEVSARPGARWLVAGGGVVLVGVGVALEIASGSIAQRLGTESFPNAAVPTELAASGAGLQTAGWVLIAAGGLVTAGGVLLALLWPEAKVAPVVSLSPGGGLLGVRGVFP